MSVQSVTPTSDERVLAGLAHFFGPVIAIIIWATQKDKSRFVRFQATQAVAFDTTFVIVFVIGFACLMAILLGGGLLGTASGLALANDENSAAAGGLLATAAVIVPLAGQCILFAVAGVFTVFKIIAVVNVLQGKDYRHPILGERVEQWVSRRSMGNPSP